MCGFPLLKARSVSLGADNQSTFCRKKPTVITLATDFPESELAVDVLHPVKGYGHPKATFRKK